MRRLCRCASATIVAAVAVHGVLVAHRVAVGVGVDVECVCVVGGDRVGRVGRVGHGTLVGHDRVDGRAAIDVAVLVDGQACE